jgi:hypothetical protein
MSEQKQVESSNVDKKAMNDMFARWEAEKQARAQEKKFVILTRPNLGAMANLVRASAMSSVKEANTPFNTVAEAAAWIKENGDQKNVYEIRDSATQKTTYQKWVFGKSWHTTTWEQDQNRGYKSDKNPKMRMTLKQTS